MGQMKEVPHMIFFKRGKYPTELIYIDIVGLFSDIKFHNFQYWVTFWGGYI